MKSETIINMVYTKTIENGELVEGLCCSPITDLTDEIREGLNDLTDENSVYFSIDCCGNIEGYSTADEAVEHMVNLVGLPKLMSWLK